MALPQLLNIALVVPIYNAADDIPFLLPAIMQQTLRPNHILFIDSSSTDQSKQLLSDYPIQIHTISKTDFDHGGTRKLGTELIKADIYIFLTQDAYPANPGSFQALITQLLSQNKVGCVYGRQIPKHDASPLGKHARLFNYATTDQIRTIQDKDQYGIKTCFNSDSFAAYKRDALLAVGNFPTHIMTGEDTYLAAKMLKAGYAVAYAANATVLHSHNLSLKEEFHRYFSIGVLHGREHILFKEFHSATGEGLRFVKSEIYFLIKKRKLAWLPRAFMSSFVKFVAYKLGMHDYVIPAAIKKKLGINKSYWLKSVTMSA